MKTLVMALALAIAPLNAHATTVEEQTSAVGEYLGLKLPDAKDGWFLIGQTVSPDGRDAIGYPTYKVFKDEQACKTELSVIKDDPPPILQGHALSCHPISALSCHQIGEHEVSCHKSAIDDGVHFAANEQTRFYDSRGNSVVTATRDSQGTTVYRDSRGRTIGRSSE
jgi:hypothetical protein